MKYCPKCKKEFDTEAESCPVSGEKLLDWREDEGKDELDEGEIVAVMTTIGLL